MRVTIVAKTSSGWWSVGLVVASVLFFVLSQVILGPGPDYDMALAYALTAVIAGIAAAAFVIGIISTMKSKDRSVFVFVAMAN
ncbi:MAG: hypothetical protein HYX84_08270 [Chloroflexi bacterium]|nr:hypothetical protein [Chloroflexota bacterium]